ncbi:MAG: hypothetical protein JWN73_1957 [Betaproteobacteria bacterium]|nr:hypothetical protein [Betaproteobacteria bacterium]
MRVSILALAVAAFCGAAPLIAGAADKPAAAGQAMAIKPQPGIAVLPPGQISGVSLTPNTVKSSEQTTATIAGSGHCKFTVNGNNGLILNEDADLPAKVPMSFIVNSNETRVFTVKVDGVAGCKGSVTTQITVGQPVQGPGTVDPSKPLMSPVQQNSITVKPNP